MSRPVARAWCGVAAVLAAQAMPATAAPPRAFTSPAGFAVRYPAGWTRVEASARLLILSRGRRVQGPVIGPGQAAILVRMLAPGEAVPPAATRASLHTAACPTWLERETRDASDPGPIEVDRSLYCVDGRRTLLVQLTHWADDRHQAAWRRTATAVAASVRFVEGKGGRPPATPHP